MMFPLQEVFADFIASNFQKHVRNKYHILRFSPEKFTVHKNED